MTKPSQELLCLQFFPHLLHIAGGRTGVAADAADAADVDAVDAVDAVDPAEAFIQTHELRARRHVGHGHGRVPRVGHWHWASGSGGATWENCTDESDDWGIAEDRFPKWVPEHHLIYPSNTTHIIYIYMEYPQLDSWKMDEYGLNPHHFQHLFCPPKNGRRVSAPRR